MQWYLISHSHLENFTFVDHTWAISFFNGLAHERNFHPVSEYESWYRIKSDDIAAHKVYLLPLLFDLTIKF